MQFHTACKCQRLSCGSTMGSPFGCNAISHRLQVPTYLFWQYAISAACRCNAISHRLQVPTFIGGIRHRVHTLLQCNFTPLASANLMRQVVLASKDLCCNAISHRLQVPTISVGSIHFFSTLKLQCNFTPLASANIAGDVF